MNDPRMPQLYENTRYNFERNARKTITIYTAGGGTVTQTYNLHEPITIDTLSDVYIDSFISNNGTDTSANTAVFLLGVDEFNIRSVAGATSKTDASKYHNKIIIPNTAGSADAAKTIAHRATKFNYVGTINPCTLHKLTISLTKNNLASLDSGAYWITFVIVSKE